MNLSMKTLKIGDILPISTGGTVTVIEMSRWDIIRVKHNDKHGHISTVQLSQLNAGNVKNPFLANVYGVGYLGSGPYSSKFPKTNEVTPEYRAWSGILQRSYSSRWHTFNPSYIGCSVDEKWHNFQVFAKWYCSQVNYGKGYELDKDILKPGNKVYCPDTVCLVPKEINMLFCSHHAKITDNGLPTGVTRVYGGKYSARLGKNNLGVHNTVEAARATYVYAKRNLVTSLINKYRGSLSDKIIDTMQRYMDSNDYLM